MKKKFKYLILAVAIFQFKIDSKITLSMVVKNEADKYLKEVLLSAKEYIDDAVIIDDASTDNTVEVCQETLKGIPLTIVKNQVSKFSNEINLRKQQWEETLKVNPEWIVFLDADQIFESKAKDHIKQLTNQNHYDVLYFRLFDFWNSDHYREDTYWKAHLIYRPFMIKYKTDFHYIWREIAQHCGSFPYNITSLPGFASDLRIKHMGWAKPEDRLSKYERYMTLDPRGEFGILGQYKAILDESPKLVKWIE